METANISTTPTGFYCSTSGTYFVDKESLTEHYKSDFHRYNLKRKVAGLPPVTKDWFEARKAQLLAKPAQAATEEKLWIDPLTKKKFMSEKTYFAFVRSKKYLELVKKSGKPAPEPIISDKNAHRENAPVSATAPSGNTGFNVVLPSGGLPIRMDKLAMEDEEAEDDEYSGVRKNVPAKKAPAPVVDDEEDGEGEEEEEEEASSDWETVDDEDEIAEVVEAEAEAASSAKIKAKLAKLAKRKSGADDEAEDNDDEEEEDADEEEEQEWKEWDVNVSLFDNFRSATMQDNIAYMWRKFGFVIPDSQYLKDPEGLVKYLGAKLQYGHVALYTSGDDANAKQFSSLHAVQRHMIDTNQCRMLYDDNEEEYEDFYEYDGDDFEEEVAESQAVALVEEAGAAAARGNGFELVVGTDDAGRGGKLLGSREFVRYYRQSHKPEDTRVSVRISRTYAQYLALGAPVAEAETDKEVRKFATRATRQRQDKEIKMSIIKNTLKKLPKNCEY